jgi:hypothetical protein
MSHKPNPQITDETMNDLVVIGEAYMEGGLREYASWSERMLRELGEPIRPYLLDIYSHAVDIFARAIAEERESLAYDVKVLRRRLEQADKDLTTAISGAAITPTRGMTKPDAANAEAITRFKLSREAQKKIIARVRERLQAAL